VNTKRILLGGLLSGAVIVIGEIVRQAIIAPAASASGASMPMGVFILRGVSLGIFCLLWNAIQLPLATAAGAWLYRETASDADLDRSSQLSLPLPHAR
jgi:hypothetical protein